MDSPSDGLVDSTATFVPPEAIELFQRVGRMVVAVAISLFSFLFFRKFLFYLTWRSFRDGPYVIGYHQWRPGNVAGPHWCNICESIVYGIRSYVVTCDICGMFAHAQCAASTMKKRSSPATDKMPCACKQAATAPQRAPPLAWSSPQDSQQHDMDGMIPHALALIEERHASRSVQPHVWIKGNIDPMDTCSICGLFCGSILALSGLKCAWCHMRVHENCFTRHSTSSSRHHPSLLLRSCRLGRHAQLILPPSHVRLATSNFTNTTTSQRALSTVRNAAQMAVSTMNNIRLRRPSSAIPTSESKAISPCSSPRQEKLSIPPVESMPFEIIKPKELTPLLVFINSRSGGQMGLHVLRHIRRWLNPLQIYDLSHQSPMAPLIQFQSIPRLRILVCGGDGTVSWVLSALDELGASRQPPIAILPLGTGNDLARVLGWGSGFSMTNVSDILTEVENAHVSLLDRWRVEIDGQVRGVCNNYVGVGVDAQVALEFHQQRERSPSLFMSQFVNKLWYTRFGTKNFLVRTCAGLPSKIKVECDGQTIILPEGTEGVILLNINSYGGGSKLWHEDSEPDSDSSSEDSDSEMETDEGMSSFSDSMSASSSPERRGRPSRERIGSVSGRMGSGRSRCGPSSPHDGLLDVVAVYGTLHLGQMQVGLSKAVRLCQAKRVKITLLETLPLQIDGEPWLQPPSQMDISFHTQAFMLSRTVQERDLITRRVGEVLDWAESTSVISSSQRDVLLAEIARRVADESSSGASAGFSAGSGAISRREGNLSIISN